MTWSLDTRIPVVLLPDAAALPPALAAHPGAAVMLPDPMPVPAEAGAGANFLPEAHVVGCTCCGGRLPAAVALDRLFLDRVRGHAPFFRCVLAVDHAGQVARALASDPVVGARFRAA